MPLPQPTPAPTKPLPLTPEQRVERAKKAVAARWAKVNWDSMPLDEAIASLAELRDEYERASRNVQQRITQPATIACNTCSKVIANMQSVCQTIVYRDKRDQLIKSMYFCSAACISRFNKQKQEERLPDIPKLPDDSSYMPK